MDSMNLYLIERPDDNPAGYDDYDSAVVCANSEDEARMIHPRGTDWDGKAGEWDSWVGSETVRVTLIGVATAPVKGVVCASFNAG